MSLRLKGGNIFLHIPKTGGSWVENVLRKLDLVESSFAHKHADFDRSELYEVFGDRISDNKKMLRTTTNIILKKISRSLHLNSENENFDVDKQIFRFCFVRHPLKWYESWWKYMQGNNWNDWGEPNSVRFWHPNSSLNGLGDTDFNKFVEKVINKKPGYVTELFYSYTKEGISFIGRTENLVNDLSTILKKLGYNVDENLIRNTEKENVSMIEQSPIWDPDLKETVMKLELPALIHFGYLTEEDAGKLGISKNQINVNPKLILSDGN